MLLYLTVKPNQRISRVERTDSGWTVKLAAPPTEGKANEELLLFISRLLGLPKSAVRLVKGHTSRLKCVDVPLDKNLVEALLEAAAG